MYDCKNLSSFTVSLGTKRPKPVAMTAPFNKASSMFTKVGLEELDCPPQSPDLNCHLQDKLEHEPVMGNQNKHSHAVYSMFLYLVLF